MATRGTDTVRIEGDFGEFDVFNAVAVINDFTRPGEAAFDIGNDGTYTSLVEEQVAIGGSFRVFVNDRLRLTGRVEMNNAPFDADQGAPMKFVVRTKLADATYASALGVKVGKGTSIKNFIVAVFEPLQYTEADFVFNVDSSRDLMTGVASDGSDSPVELDPIKEEQLKVNPPETIYAACDRILKRHGLMLWDSPDGKLVIGAPNDQQTPLYDFRMFTDPNRTRQNNVLSATRNRDFSGAPAWLGVYGVGSKQDWRKSKVGAVAKIAEVAGVLDKNGRPVFWRPVVMIDEGVKTDEIAARHANREATNRSKGIDTWDIEVDGLSYWNGSERIPYGIDTVATVSSQLAGGVEAQPYLITRVQMKRDVSNGDTTHLTLLKKGLWVL